MIAKHLPGNPYILFINYLLTGVPSLGVFSGNCCAGFSSTFPVIRNTTVFVLAFDLTVTVLLIGPAFLVLYVTWISLDSPGKTGSLGHVGTVHPHEDCGC